MKSHPDLLTTADQIAHVASRMREHSIVAFDTEFIREKSFYPQLEIIQVATDEESWLIDAQAFQNHKPHQPSPAFLPIQNVLVDPNILKVVHAAEADQECLYTQFGFLAQPILDTAIAASLCGYGENLGLAALLKSVMDINLKKGYARTHWSERPLPSQLAEYAHADVIHLVELGRILIEKLEELNRKDWALEICEKFCDPNLFEPDPESMAARLSKSGRIKAKNYPILLELIRWRESKVREMNIPRRWLADDNVLMNLAEMRPKNSKLLKSFRGLNQRALQNEGKEILEAIEHGEQLIDVKMPKFDRPKPPSTNEARAVSLLRCYVEYLASKHNIAAKQLVDLKLLIEFLRHPSRDPQDWVDQGLLSQFSANLIGHELAELMNGNRALTIEKKRIQVLENEE